MNIKLNRGINIPSLFAAASLFLLTALAPSSSRAAFTINLKSDTGAGISDFKWIVQEDNTWDAVSNLGKYNSHDSLSVSLHKSTAKVLATGTGANPVVNLPASGRYFVSVLAPGYTLTGGSVRPNATSVSLVTHSTGALPSAQISAMIFQDNNPVNGAPDAEAMLPNFKVLLYDTFGQQAQDICANPIGTVYTDSASCDNVSMRGPGYVVSSPIAGQVYLPNGVLSAPIPGLVGNVLIQNLGPGRYGVRAIPSDGRPWVQTSTIEGTPGIDNWVVAGEPTYYTEAGFFGVHSFIGFVMPTDYSVRASGDLAFFNQNVFRIIAPLSTTETYGQISGQVVKNRINRPPQQMGLNPGEPVPGAWISLSNFGASQSQVFALGCPGTTAHLSGDPALASSCDSNANFTINGVPPGTYTLTMWDKPLDQLIDFRTVTVPVVAPPGTAPSIALGKIPIFQWFGIYEGSYFTDSNLNGIRDSGEQGIANLGAGIRFRDGSIYQGTASTADGSFAFEEVFPFFKWIIAESDYSRLYPTGATIFVDKGGANIFNPVAGDPSLLEVRTEAPGPGSILQGFMLFFDNSMHIDWGRVPYPVTLPDGTTVTNGGISGVVTYAFTRAAGDPSLGAQAPWEPGQADVKFKLWKPTGFDTNGKPKFDPPYDKPIAETVSDSWDRFAFEEPVPQPDTRSNKGLNPTKGLLTGCLDSIQNAGLSVTPQEIPLNKYVDCAETISTWNQVKPAVYDGGWIFSEYTDPLDGLTKPLPAGKYVVEMIPPPGYEVVKEEDQNLAFSGDSFLPSKPQPALLPASCVGPDHIVPPVLSWDGVNPSPSAGLIKPLCTMKLIDLQDGQNAGTEFRIFTQVPLAARIIGLVTDDLALEFRPGNPRLGDKPGPSFMPISIQDFTGHELVRTYSDEWGIYNALVPSTYTTNIPNPTGVSPGMVRILLNHPGFDPVNPDPWYNPGYPTAEWKIDVWAGKTTYADTPIVPIRPQIGAADLDCNLPEGTPGIKQVDGSEANGGPWVMNPADTTKNIITLTAVGDVVIKNSDPNIGGTVSRNYGFGNKPGSVTLNGNELAITQWTNSTVKAVVPIGATTGQLNISRGDNLKTSVTGVTLHIGGSAIYVPTDYSTIQAAIDAAANGDLILIKPGIYAENLIMNKPVLLQGYGANSTFIKAGFFTPEKKALWDANLASFLTTIDELTYSIDPVNNPVPVFNLDSGAGITVLGRHDRTNDTDPEVPDDFTNDDFNNFPARIDGLNITGANLGGGIYVHAYAHNLQITNNILIANQGTFGGGIRLGTPTVIDNTSSYYLSSFNDNITMSRNQVISNGGIGTAVASGGGIALYEGSDNYKVTDSWICGNYATLAGAGIAQFGLSNADSAQSGLIERNHIIFNEAFDEGAGIFIGGELPIPPATVTIGAGNVTINNNLLQGNKAGNLGGGIALLRFNGEDVTANPTDPSQWYRAKIYNNMIVNNISGGYGGGIAIFDAVNTDIIWNTIANNDSTATGELSFGNVPFVEGPIAGINMVTTPAPAGIGVQPVSPGLLSQIDIGIQSSYADFTAAPNIINNIITGNFSRFWANTSFNQIDTLTDYGYWDVGIFGSADPNIKLQPSYSFFTDPALAPIVVTSQQGGSNNFSGDPQLVSPYRNTISAFQGGAALGNFIAYAYTPMALTGNYHIKGTSPAISMATIALPNIDPADATGLLTLDYDNDPRPIVPLKTPDIGADEYNNAGDVTNDGIINTLDVLIVLNGVVSGAPYNAAWDVAPLINGKPSKNGVVDLADVLLLLQRALGIITW